MLNRALASVVLLALLHPCAAVAQTVAVGQDRLAAVTNVFAGDKWLLYALVTDFQGRNDAPVLLAEGDDARRAAIAGDGEHFLVAWADEGRTKSDVRAAIVGGAALVLARDVEHDAFQPPVPIAGSTSTGFFVVWQTSKGADVALISSAGVIEARHSIPVAGRAGAAAIGLTPVLLSVVRGQERIALQATFLRWDWKPFRTVTIATHLVSTGGGSNFITDPQLAWNGNQFYVTWTAMRTGRYLYVEGTRLTADAAVLDVYETCELGPAGSCGGRHRTAGRRIYSACCLYRSDALLMVGSRFVKAWQGPGRWTSSELQASWIDVDGTASEPNPLQKPEPFFYLYSDAVAALPDGELVIVRVTGTTVELRRVGSSARRRAVRGG